MFAGAGQVLVRLTVWGPSLLSVPARAAVAVGLTLVGLGLRFALAPQDGGIPFVTFFPAATLTAIFAGLWAGLAAALLGAATALWFFIPPLNGFKLDWHGLMGAMVFILDEVVVCSAIETMRRTYQEYLKTSESLRAAGLAEAEARLAAERADQAKTRFLAAVSHDLRQPWQAMRLYLAGLEVRAHNPAAVLDLVKRMEAAMEAGETLLQSLADVSRLNAGVVMPQAVAIDTAELIETLAQQHRPVAAAKGLKFRVTRRDMRLVSDPALLSHLLANLLTNAIRYTEKGSVSLGLRRLGGMPAFLVRDTGIGIAPEHQDEVFEEFFQIGNTARDRRNGIGLGLTVAKRCAELLGLDLRMRSRPGRGTLFVLVWPRDAGIMPGGS